MKGVAVTGGQRLKSLAVACASGLALTASFPVVLPFAGPFPLLDFFPREVLIVPGAALFYWLAIRDSRGRFGWALLAAFVHFMTLLFWLDVAMTQFGRMPTYQAVLARSLLAGYCALYLATLPTLTAWVCRRVRLPPWLCFVAAVVALEWARTEWLTGFPWGLWGYSQARNLPLANLAAWGGVALVSALLAMTSALLVEAWHGRLRWRAFVLIVIATHLPGAARWIAYSDPVDGALKIALLQGNIGQDVKNRGATSGREVARIYRELLAEAETAAPDLVVWPETSWPYAISAENERFAVDTHMPMVVGVIRREAGSEATAGGVFNSSIYVDATGSILGSQAKMHLVPFGEYVPLREILPIKKIVPGMVDLTPGKVAAPLGPERVGVLICYDGIFPEIARQHAGAGAELIANLTNDGWYGITSGPFQHRDFYVFRAIETDRFVLRATNTGVSAIVGPRGVIRAETRLGTADVLLGTAHRRSSSTLFVWVGNWVTALALGVVLAVLIASFANPSSRAAAHRNQDR